MKYSDVQLACASFNRERPHDGPLVIPNVIVDGNVTLRFVGLKYEQAIALIEALNKVLEDK